MNISIRNFALVTALALFSININSAFAKTLNDPWTTTCNFACCWKRVVNNPDGSQTILYRNGLRNTINHSLICHTEDCTDSEGNTRECSKEGVIQQQCLCKGENCNLLDSTAQFEHNLETQQAFDEIDDVLNE